MAPDMKAIPWGDEQVVNTAIDEAITSIIENKRDVSTALQDAESIINATIEQTNR
jgi:maltose-binding protein MalE